MTESLLQRLRNPEDNLTERKPAGVNAAEIRRTLVAFANSVIGSEEAILFIGVSDEGGIQGVPSPDKLQKTVREQCEKICHPSIVVRIEVLAVEGKQVLVVAVPESLSRPHFSGPAFIRRGSESVSASEDSLAELLDRRISKVAAILDMRGGPITVVSIRHRLGSTRPVPSGRTVHECQVVSCTAHVLRLHDISQGITVSEPLANVEQIYDEKKHRHMLIVRAERGSG